MSRRLTSTAETTLAQNVRDRAGVFPARYFGWQSALHRAVAAVLLLPGIPIVLVLIALIRITSRGPGLFRQQRVGRHGKPFMLYKLRTMCIDAEARTGPVWTTSLHDPRITPLGRVLRLLHLDEFPQLWNILRGDMSLIGPRPERPEFTQLLARQIPGYLDRLAVLPGITGLAQIQLPADSDLESVRRKVAVDLEYIRRGSLGMDLRIFLCTAARLLGIKGACASRLFGLEYHPPQARAAGESSPVQASTLLAGTVQAHSLIETLVVDRRSAAAHSRNGSPRVPGRFPATISPVPDTNGHAENGHSRNGHSENGHSENGHARNGHHTPGFPPPGHDGAIDSPLESDDIGAPEDSGVGLA
jgi:lipopolysaccharide/colanic/teichoic acid biosynthesis glycosyltransferase